MNGSELAHDLCEHLRSCDYFAAVEVPLTKRSAFGMYRADVYAIKLHEFARKDTRIYEVKVSKADFRNGIERAQAEAYSEYARRVFFAVPAGLVKKVDVPDGIGLVTRGDKGWSVVVSPRPTSVVEPPADLLLLLMARAHRPTEARRLRDRLNLEDNVALQDRAKNIGYDIRRRLAGKPNPRADIAMRLLSAVERHAGLEPYDDTRGVRKALSTYDMQVRMDQLTEVATRLVDEADRLTKVGRYLSGMGDRLYHDSKTRAQVARAVDRALP